ncbi:MAG: chloride channel protein, partial [Clostridia bacterium]|nr:chloride channel protein [Clostridia bacterium]
MKAKFQIYKNYFVNLIFPALIFGSITGILTSVIVTLFKLCAKYVISFSQTMLNALKERVYLIPIALIIVFGLSVLIDLILKKEPNLRGGGIPTSISALRGITVLNWFKALLGGFFLPLISFAFGVPLGTEGPSVLIGTATGNGSVRVLASKHRAWNKYAMTGGASAGFSVATGSPIAGIMFAIEEVHGRISPMIIMVATISVAFSRLTSELLNKISFLNVDIQLFPKLTSIQPLRMINVWIPIVVAIVIGLLAVVFLYYYRVVYTFFNKALIKVPSYIRIFIVFAAVVFAVSSALMLRQLFEYRAARQLEDAAREIAAGITLNTELPEVPPALTDVPKTEEAYEEVPQPQPIEEDAAFMLELDMQALKTANSDVIGWIYVPGTAIDYPLVQGSDNSKYLNTAWDGTWNKAGAIFMEERNSAEFDDFNTIIYGHNMGNGSMFSDLHLYRDPGFLPEN